ncbi:MAG: hypothetical protein P1V97_29525 [Planctomycetota bacterium]|nr:hypothetical protein [Planctomycetota bacterium]
MDKLRREAERSGDSLRYALELRRQGQDLRAKRLIQDLAWDKHTGAEEALEQLYSLNEEMRGLLDILSRGPAQASLAMSQLLGSLDPRINKEISEQIPRCLRAFRGNESLCANMGQIRQLVEVRSLIDRLRSTDTWSFRLVIADPLEEELAELLDWFLIEFNYRKQRFYDRHNDLLLGWTLCEYKHTELLQKWEEDYRGRAWPELIWRERLGERLKGTLPAQLVPDVKVIPDWAMGVSFSGLNGKSYALQYTNFFHERSIQEGLALDKFVGFSGSYLIFLNLGSLRKPIVVRELRRRFAINKKLVSRWQGLVGDRVMSRDHDFVILWEFGNLQRLIPLLELKAREVIDNFGHGHLSIGVSADTGNWSGTIDNAEKQNRKAREQGLTYLPECLEL